MRFAAISSMVFISEGNIQSGLTRSISIVRASALRLKSMVDNMPNNESKPMITARVGSLRKA